MEEFVSFLSKTALTVSVMYLPNLQFILFHIGGEGHRNVTCLATLFLNKLDCYV